MSAWLTSGFSIGVASSIAGALILYILQSAIGRLRLQPVRSFWAGFERAAVIMTSEYTIESQEVGPWHSTDADGIEFEDEDQLIAVRSTSGYFLSYGMSVALGNLVAFFRRDLGSSVQVMGDKGHSRPRDGKSLVVLGSPINNRYLQRFFHEMRASYPLLPQFSWRLSDRGVSLTLPDGETLTPTVNEEEDGIDYALVACVNLDQGKSTRLVIIAGCNMWGTEAATNFLLDAQLVRLLPAAVRRRRGGSAFVLKAWISHGLADHVELQRNRDGSVAYDLSRARS